jgi:hypothetical protein
MSEVNYMGTKVPKLAQASSNLLDVGPAGGTWFNPALSNEPDKLQIPDKWPLLVKAIRFYYDRDPLASSVVNKSVDIGLNELTNNQGDTPDNVLAVYDYFKDDLIAFLKDMAREYLLSGLVIPEVGWGTQVVKLKRSEKVFTLPTSLWIRDPASIIAKKTPIPNRINYYVEVDSETIQFILQKGRYPDGTVDTKTFEMLLNQYPEFVQAVRDGKTIIPLTNIFVTIRRAPTTGKVYPTPYFLSALESLIYKRKLRKMDYAIAARVIQAIQVVTLGNDKYPLTEADGDQLEDLKKRMLFEGRDSNVERIFQLVGNHTLEIKWVFPDTNALLNNSKYDAVNQDIMFALGFPRILLSGETEKSATSNPEFAMFSPSETLKSMRKDLMPFVKKLYKEIARLNGFDKYPTPEFGSLQLYDVEKMATTIATLMKSAHLSNTSALRSAGFNFEDEIQNIIREREIMKENDIPEFAPQPFSPKPTVPGSPSTDNTKTQETN